MWLFGFAYLERGGIGYGASAKKVMRLSEIVDNGFFFRKNNLSTLPLIWMTELKANYYVEELRHIIVLSLIT